MSYDTEPWWVVEGQCNNELPLNTVKREGYKTAKKGYVYVLSNPSLEGTVKIGMTTRDVNSRVKELSKSTSIPTPFKVEYYIECENPYDKEQSIHNKLSHKRVNEHREFFDLTIEEAIKIVDSICESEKVRELKTRIRELEAENACLHDNLDGYINDEVSRRTEKISTQYKELIGQHSRTLRELSNMRSLNEKLVITLEEYADAK